MAPRSVRLGIVWGTGPKGVDVCIAVGGRGVVDDDDQKSECGDNGLEGVFLRRSCGR
jgi:hypothetical protein